MKRIFAAFVAGTLFVGSFMFISDKYDLFGGSSRPLITEGNIIDSTVQTASLAGTGETSIADIVKQSEPAVVKISTSKGGQASGIGSGFIFDAAGYILTNDHVVDGASSIEVSLQGYDTPFKATLLGSSYDLDLAVLKIEGTQAFPTLPIGDSDKISIGEWVVAIGNPYDLDFSVTAGVLSAKERPISISDEKGTRNYTHLLQTDTAINPGNSGGPLLNLQGEVIGINTAVSAEAQGIGFAIPTSTVKSVIEQLIKNEAIPSPYLGINVQDITANMFDTLHITSTDGAVVATVQQAAPADLAGLRQYDVILAVNNEDISSSQELINHIKDAKVGDQLTLSVTREGKTQQIKVTVGDKNDFQSS